MFNRRPEVRYKEATWAVAAKTIAILLLIAFFLYVGNVNVFGLLLEGLSILKGLVF